MKRLMIVVGLALAVGLVFAQVVTAGEMITSARLGVVHGSRGQDELRFGGELSFSPDEDVQEVGLFAEGDGSTAAVAGVIYRRNFRPERRLQPFLFGEVGAVLWDQASEKRLRGGVGLGLNFYIAKSLRIGPYVRQGFADRLRPATGFGVMVSIRQ